MKHVFGFVLVLALLLNFYPAMSQYHLVWQDEFQYEGHLDSSKWNYETGGHVWGNN